MNSELASFFVGVVLTSLALMVFLDIRNRMRRTGTNQVTTISQMLQLAVQGAPTGVAIVDRGGEVVLSNARAHAMGVVHQHNLHPAVWDAVQQVLVDLSLTPFLFLIFKHGQKLPPLWDAKCCGAERGRGERQIYRHATCITRKTNGTEVAHCDMAKALINGMALSAQPIV